MVNDTNTVSIEKYYKKIFPPDSHLRYLFVTNTSCESLKGKSKRSKSHSKTNSFSKRPSTLNSSLMQVASLTHREVAINNEDDVGLVKHMARNKSQGLIQMNKSVATNYAKIGEQL